MTQRERVVQMLRQSGRVNAHELTYQHGITRTAAIIHKLRQDGWQIDTTGGDGQQAVYVLRQAPAARPRTKAPAMTGHQPFCRWQEATVCGCGWLDSLRLVPA